MRPSWDKYFMSIAETIATMATCDRKHVGAVIVKNKRIIATGYNGSMVERSHCDKIGHLMRDGHCIRTVHAEINALAQCSRYGIVIDGATMYITTFPCWNCYKAVVNAGIKEIIYLEKYNPDPEILLDQKIHILSTQLTQFKEV